MNIMRTLSITMPHIYTVNLDGIVIVTCTCDQRTTTCTVA